MSTEPFSLSSEPPPAKRQFVAMPVELLVEHPFSYRQWYTARLLPEPGWWLVCTTEGQVLALHESQFRINEQIN
jgi:hypothetical protein